MSTFLRGTVGRFSARFAKDEDEFRHQDAISQTLSFRLKGRTLFQFDKIFGAFRRNKHQEDEHLSTDVTCRLSKDDGRQSHLKQSQESVFSLMSTSNATSGLGLSQSPLIFGPLRGNYRRSTSNKRFSNRNLLAAVQCNKSMAGSCRGSIVDGCSLSPRFCEPSTSGLENERLTLSTPNSLNTHLISQTGCFRADVHSTVDGVPCPTIKLALKPIKFEFSNISNSQPFVGRDWVFHEICDILVRPRCPNKMKGAVLSGACGTGKTTILYNILQEGRMMAPDNRLGLKATDWRQITARATIAYHFCRIEDRSTCCLANFLLNIIAQTARHRDFAAFYEKLIGLVDSLTVRQFLEDPVSAFKHCYTDPLNDLWKKGAISFNNGFPWSPRNFLILVDALDEAEYHRPENSDSIASFLVKNAQNLLPSFIKLILTIRNSYLNYVKGLPLHKIDLDYSTIENNQTFDCIDYVSMRVHDKADLRKRILDLNYKNSNFAFNNHRARNVSSISCDKSDRDLQPVLIFAENLVHATRSNFLSVKLILDVLESPASNPKNFDIGTWPTDLRRIFEFVLNFTLTIRRRKSDDYRKIFSIMLSSLEPMNAKQIFEVLKSYPEGNENMSFEDFDSRLTSIDHILQKFENGKLTFFHPAFREFLMLPIQDSNRSSFSDVRKGHTAIAIAMSKRKNLDGDELQTMCHHLLKAQLYKFGISGSNNYHHDSPCLTKDALLNLIANSAADLKRSICTERNVFRPNTQVSRLLLLAGADPNACLPTIKSETGIRSMLFEAVNGGREYLASVLIEFGADINTTDPSNGKTPLMLAAAGGNLDFVELLHQRGATLNQVDVDNRTALTHAVLNSQINVLSFLLECDWSNTSRLNENFDSKSNALTTECMTRDHIVTTASRQDTIQHSFVLASATGNLKMVQFLLEFTDVSIDQSCPFTLETALSIACLKGFPEMVQILLQHNAKTKYEFQMSTLSPLIKAVEGGNWEIVSSLLSKGVDVNSERNEKMETALIKAAQFGHVGIIELLLTKQAELNAVDYEGKTAFCWACLNDKVPCADLLLQRGANVDTIDHSDNSPVHYLASVGSDQMIQTIVGRCTNFAKFLELSDAKKRRPLEIAIENNNLSAVQHFLRKGTKLLPITWSVAEDKPKILSVLFHKLLNDGRILYNRNQLQEATSRFRYALKKLDLIPSTVCSPLKINNNDDDSLSVAENSTICTNNIDDRRFNSLQLRYQLLLCLAKCKRKSGDLTAAVEFCTEAASTDPRYAEAFFCRGRCFYDLQQYDKAKKDLCAVLKLDVNGHLYANSSNRCFQDSSKRQQLNRSKNSSLSILNFGKEAQELIGKIDEKQTKRMTFLQEARQGQSIRPPRNWEQGSADSGNMPDIEALKV